MSNLDETEVTSFAGTHLHLKGLLQLWPSGPSKGNPRKPMRQMMSSSFSWPKCMTADDTTLPLPLRSTDPCSLTPACLYLLEAQIPDTSLPLPLRSTDPCSLLHFSSNSGLFRRVESLGVEQWTFWAGDCCAASQHAPGVVCECV